MKIAIHIVHGIYKSAGRLSEECTEFSTVPVWFEDNGANNETCYSVCVCVCECEREREREREK